MQSILFVYGTLRRGLRLHHHMGDASYLCEARLKGQLYDIDYYPGLIIDPNANWVTGELFAVDDLILTRLDAVEGYDPHSPTSSDYLRQEVTVLKPNDEEFSVLTYTYNHPVQGLSRIDSGDYKEYLKNQS